MGGLFFRPSKSSGGGGIVFPIGISLSKAQILEGGRLRRSPLGGDRLRRFSASALEPPKKLAAANQVVGD